MNAQNILTDLRTLDREYLTDCAVLRSALSEQPAKLYLAITARGERYDEQRTALLAQQRGEIDEAMRILENDDAQSHVSPAHSRNGHLARTNWRHSGIGQAQR